MANYIINQKNELIGRSGDILDYLTGMYMDRYRAGILAQSGDSYRLERFSYKHILSYRKTEDDEAFQERIRSAFRKLLGLLFTEDCGLGYFISSTGSAVQMTLAIESKSNLNADRALGSSIPELQSVSLPNADFEWKQKSAWGGVIVNIPPQGEGYIDYVLQNLIGLPGNVGILAFPSTRSESYMAGLMDLKGQVDSLNDFSYTYGAGSRRTITPSFPELNKLGDYLERQIKRWAGTHGMWETCIWFSAETEHSADRLGAMLAGAVGGQKEATDAPCMYFLTDRNPFQTGIFEVPGSEYAHQRLGVPGGLIKSPLESFLTFDDLSALLQLPTYSHPGVDVLVTGSQASPLRPFDIGNNPIGELTIGHISDTGAPFHLRMDDLTEHALVTGATGSGKTNTVMRIIDEACRRGVPYCIIEPSKKDYWLLLSRDETLQVFSAGQDALPLQLNPFVPEQGVDIAAHISAVMYAFSGAFDMETPTRFALEGLLKHSYQDAGWDLADIYYGQRRRIPQISDLIHNLPEFMERELQYGPEVWDNIKGAILNRLRSMNEGIVSRIVTCTPESSLSGERLCSTNALIELDDLPIDLKSFVAELILMKVSQYLRRQNPSQGLRNLIVLEEAHNIFSDISHQQPQTSKAIASEYFSNMLSEIREYGTGLVIADQGASRINSNAIANTKVKILHSVASKADAEAESYAMHMDDMRMSYLPGFSTGEALVAVRGVPQVWKVNVAKVPRNRPKNIACLFCRHRQMCMYNDVEAALPLANGSLEASIQAAVLESYNMANWGALVSWVQRQYGLDGTDESCLLGCLLERFADSLGAREKRRILYLFNKWRADYANT